MPEDPLWVSEHGTIFRGRRNQVLEDGNLVLGEGDFQSLETLLEEDQFRDDGRQAALEYTRPSGRPAFRVRNLVGLICTGSGTHIEVLPKLSRHSGPETCRDLLLRMLIELKDSPFREASPAELQGQRMPLFELLMKYFLAHTATVVRQGIARGYVRREENLNTLRGKLLIRKNIRHNYANAARFYCEYEEFVANRPVNRLLRGGLDIVARASRLPVNRRMCRELQAWFEDVPASTDWRKDFRHLQWDRNVRHYKEVLPPCRLLHEHLNPLTAKGENRALSMLFPMERVFEDFVAAKLPRQFHEFRVRKQVSGRHLVADHDGKAIFRLRPDLILTTPTGKIVADTKWKLIDAGNRARNYGIKQSDMYQLFAYCKKLAADSGSHEVWLIYPRHDGFQGPLEPFLFDDSGDRVMVVPYDLEKGRLILHESMEFRGYSSGGGLRGTNLTEPDCSSLSN